MATLDEDRILRRFLNALRCTLRTNFWQRLADGAPKDWISFKIDSRAIDELPAPRPLVEIFVYSPRMEGIHLRGGRVARGGIRWSDRREDFRTEILGLMKTQMVKNAVIVPVGSKGGFYVKRPPAGGPREQVQAEGIACYQTLIRGLLDITDNYVGDGIEPPANVVRHDADDPYLVVAADKGTATFSDIANTLAREYGFWLDDAFASGGSAGYDHKKMGITARGAWESVKRHFRELGQDIQTHAVHRDRRRRHVGRRVRQRHAAVQAHQAGRGVRPPPHLHRSRAQSGDELGRAQATVRPAALVVDGLRQVAAVGGRRHLRPRRQVDRPVGRGPRRAGHRGADHDAGRPDAGHPGRAGRPALFRRHRHLREGIERKPGRRRRPRQRCSCASTATRCGRA